MFAHFMHARQTGATAVRRHEYIVPSGFVNSASIILLRCAWQGCYGPAQTKTRRFRSSLANAHVARCGWLGIHEAYCKPTALE